MACRQRPCGLLAEANPRRSLLLAGRAGGRAANRRQLRLRDAETVGPAPARPAFAAAASAAAGIVGQRGRRQVNDKNAKEISKNAPVMRARMLHLHL